MLQGFSSGVSGNLPQFMAQQDQKKLIDQQQKQQRSKELSAERKRAMALDMRGVRELLKGGMTDRAITKLNNREKVGMLLPDFDAVTTQEIRSLIATGNEQEALKYLDIIDNAAISEGVLPAMAAAEKPIALAGNERLVDPSTNEVLVPAVQETPEAAPQVPPALLAGVPAEIVPQASAAFEAAGGGSAGISAMNDVIARGREGEARQQVPQLLQASFPNASPAEMAQLEATVSGASDVESGLAAANKVREEQRRTKKAKDFQQRAVDLLTRIIEHPEVTDVVGTVQGSDIKGNILNPFRMLDQDNADIIADIEEAQNILTSENMDLMTGVLSESDIKLLKSLSSGALNRTRGDKRFIQDATKLRDTLNSRLIETIDDIAGQEARPGMMANVGENLRDLANLSADEFEKLDLSQLTTEQLQALENQLMGTAQR